MNCEEASQHLAAYALGAIEEPELGELERHLESCPACRMVLDQHRQVVRELPQTVNLVDPPARLKTKLMDRIDRLVAGEPLSAARPNLSSRFGGLLGRPLTLAGALGIFVLIGLVAWSIYQTTVVTGQQATNQRLLEELQQTRLNSQQAAGKVSDLAQVNQGLSTDVDLLKQDNQQLGRDLERGWSAMTFATSPNVKAVPLASMGASPTTKASLFIDQQDRRGLLMATGLTPVTEGYRYQLWMRWNDNSWTSLGTFKTLKDGYVLWGFDCPYSISLVKSFTVTLEPIEGNAWPTGKPVLNAETAAITR